VKFSDLQESIQQVWQFILPPFINLFVLISLTYYIAPELLFYALTKAPLINFGFLTDESFQRFLEFYGVSKLTPLFFLIGLVFTLYLVQGFVLNIGHILPGQLSNSNEDLLLHAAGREKLAAWWAKFPEIESHWALIRILENKLNTQPPERLSNIHFWQAQSARYFRLFNTLKVYLLWTLFLPVLLLMVKQPIAGAIFKALLIMVLILIVQAFVFVKQVYALEQTGFAKVSSIDALLFESDAIPKYADREIINQKHQLILDRGKHHQEKWWEFRVLDAYQFRWFFRTFLNKKSAQRVIAADAQQSGSQPSFLKRILNVARVRR
jgi:hypothetical protein